MDVKIEATISKPALKSAAEVTPIKGIHPQLPNLARQTIIDRNKHRVAMKIDKSSLVVSEAESEHTGFCGVHRRIPANVFPDIVKSDVPRPVSLNNILPLSEEHECFRDDGENESQHQNRPEINGEHCH